MRLLALRIRNFRGFGERLCEVSLDADLVLLSGPNGFGKTSFAEAIEWLLYGTTKRRLQGEKYSKTEYAGTFLNAHSTGPIEVEADVELPDGSQRTLLRQTAPGRTEASTTYVDGKPGSFSSLGVASIDLAYPVVAQHSLQSFILSRPKERRDAIGAALGLEDVSQLKNALDGAARSFSLAAPESVRKTNELLHGCVAGLTEYPDTRTLSARWAKSPPEVRPEPDIASLVAAACRATGITNDAGTVKPDDLLQPLRDKYSVLSRTVLDDSPLRAPNDAELTQSLESDWSELLTSLQTVAASVSAIVAHTAAHSAKLLSFWKAGLELAPDGSDCPMCESPTLTPEKRTDIQARLSAGASELENRTTLETARTDALRRLPQLGRALLEPERAKLTEEPRGLLRGLFLDERTALESFLVEHDGWVASLQSLSAQRNALATFLREIPSDLSNPEMYPELVRKAGALPGVLGDRVRDTSRATQHYSEVWQAFEPSLTARIARSSVVVPIGALGKALKAAESIQELGRYAGLLATARSVAQKAERFVQRKQTEILDTRGKDVKDLYALLNPGAEVGFESMEPGNEEVRLHATSFGTRMSAAANLSECQLNCLGLAFWVMQALVPSSPFGFIVLDDPVQSMDDDHAQAFLTSLLGHLLDEKKKQVLLLSHVEKLTHDARALSVGRRLREYKAESYDRKGPVIVEQVRLKRALAEIEGLTKGNEANREYAVDRLRVLVEKVVRELHLKVTGSPAPSDLDAANPHELLKLFQKIPGTQPHQHAALKHTVDFADPSHHTEVGYTVPVATNIQPHVDRLRQLMKHFDLID
jgi:energy-coupling factor transporter ATP-binding protein EcfA2